MSQNFLNHFQDLQEYASLNRIPLFGTIELTNYCNLHCQHCYNFDRKIKSPPLKHLDKKVIQNLISDFKDLGGLLIAFSGGEALLHPHFFDLLKFARDKHLMVRLKSNGTLLTSEISQKLSAYELYDAEISLYGQNQLEHDYLTTDANSFNKTIEGITNLRKSHIPVQINFIIHKKNYQSINQMIILAENLDCQYSFSTDITKRYDASDARDSLKISHDEIIYILKNNPSFFPDPGKRLSHSCECAKTVFGVVSNGDVYPCIGAPIISGNLYQNSFKEIWNESNEFLKIRNLENKDYKDCQSCQLENHCDRSSGSAWTNSSNYTGCDENAREIAQIKSLNS